MTIGYYIVQNGDNVLGTINKRDNNQTTFATYKDATINMEYKIEIVDALTKEIVTTFDLKDIIFEALAEKEKTKASTLEITEKGGCGWKTIDSQSGIRIKQNIEKSLEDLARELLDIYDKRVEKIAKRIVFEEFKKKLGK